eukprot:COSAG02_NODE_1408_length_12764_cov_254.164627_1_plen_148_part_00
MLGSDAHGAPCRAHLLLDEGRFFLRLQRTLDLVLSFCTSTRGLPCTGNRRAVQMRGTSSGSRRRRRLYTAIVIGHARPCGSRACSVQRLSRRTGLNPDPRGQTKSWQRMLSWRAGVPALRSGSRAPSASWCGGLQSSMPDDERMADA